MRIFEENWQPPPPLPLTLPNNSLALSPVYEPMLVVVKHYLLLVQNIVTTI